MCEDVKRFKLREEKHVMTEIELMAWSPSMDLLALANISGEVFVNRLSWQRVWSLAPPSEGDRVGGFAWRPDGKVIAIGYGSGIIRVCDVEKGDLVYIAAVKGTVTTVTWLEQSKQLSATGEHYAEDNSEKYLPTAQHLGSFYNDGKEQSGLEAYERFRSLTAQKELNLLIVGSNENEVSIFSYGAFPTAIVDLSSDNPEEKLSVDSALVSPDLSCLSVILKSTVNGRSDFSVMTLDTSLLLGRHVEIRLLAAKYVKIASAQMELQVIIQQMCEAWEDILREMDSKLLKFAESKRKLGQEGSVSNDFLELLLFGTTSLELESFLLHDLTDKGLKKLGFSIDTSYSNIQKLVVRQLQRVSQNITSHLSDLFGMSQWYDKYGVLGLNPPFVHVAMKSAGAFAISGSELQQVIDTSIKNFKAFFRWLYIAILRLSGEALPADLAKMTQHDVNFVADFLRDNFSHLGDEEDSGVSSEDSKAKGRHGFKLEKVGQYLKNEDLAQPPNYHENPWIQFLQSSTFQKDSKVLYPIMHGKSLLQRKEILDTSIGNAVLAPAKVIGSSMSCKSRFSLFKVDQPADPDMLQPKVCQFTDEEIGCVWIAFVMDYLPCQFLYLMRYPVTDSRKLEVAKIKIGQIGNPAMDDSLRPSDKPPCTTHLFVDFAVFNSQTLSLLLREAGECGEEEMSLLLQLPLSLVPQASYTCTEPQLFERDKPQSALDIGPLLSLTGVNYQTNAVGQALAVGGARTTASMLLKSQRRLRLFLLEEGEGEDDDEDEEEEEESQQDESSVNVVSTVDDSGGVEDDDKENMAD